tara:strand:+ start:411 stop:611 length:201 start_codon:yes stop_codon:yes gene_type:complete
MLKKLVFITEKLGAGRTDVWECEMLYKYVSKDLGDPHTENYLLSKFNNPDKALNILISSLTTEARR